MLCSNCFNDEGLRISADEMGTENNDLCNCCNSRTGKKLDHDAVIDLAHRFFVWGTLHRCEYGAAPVVQFNKHQETSINVSSWLKKDVQLLSDKLGVGFFHYGPRFWMIGEIEPLKDLQNIQYRQSIIMRIFDEYPSLILDSNDKFYRIRKAPNTPNDFKEYDSPPIKYSGTGRLDTTELSILYGSQDLQVCIHECRVTAEDELYVATLKPERKLCFLNLSALIKEKCTEFESLDLAVHMLFLAGKHSYDITRDISVAAKERGFDGIAFPSYFSLLRSGGMPFETTFGLSHRRIPELQEFEQSKIVPNLAVFGSPISQGDISVASINKLLLHRVEYGVHFGPVES